MLNRPTALNSRLNAQMAAASSLRWKKVGVFIGVPLSSGGERLRGGRGALLLGLLRLFGRLLQRAEHFVARPERNHLPVTQDQQLVDDVQDAGPVSHDDERGATALELEDGCSQG